MTSLGFRYRVVGLPETNFYNKLSVGSCNGHASNLLFVFMLLLLYVLYLYVC